MIRFLVDVCGLSLRDAAQAVRAEMLKDQRQSWEPQGETVPETADKLLKAAGDILDAVACRDFMPGLRSSRTTGTWCAMSLRP